MQGVNYPVYGQDETGYGQMMYPNQEYKFPGKMVYETPMADGDNTEVFNKSVSGATDWFASLLDNPEYYKRLKNEVKQSNALNNNVKYDSKTGAEKILDQRKTGFSSVKFIEPNSNLRDEVAIVNDLDKDAYGAHVLRGIKYYEPQYNSNGYLTKDIASIGPNKIGINPVMYNPENKDNLKNLLVHEIEHATQIAQPGYANPYRFSNYVEVDNGTLPLYKQDNNITPYAEQVIKENILSDDPYYSDIQEVMSGKRQIENMLENVPENTFTKPWKYGDEIDDEHFNYIFSDDENISFKNDNIRNALLGDKKYSDLLDVEKVDLKKRLSNIMMKIAMENSKNPYTDYARNGTMIKRADGSYSERGLWDNIRANKGSGKKPTEQMLEQEKKIKKQEMQSGGKTNPYLQAQAGTQASTYTWATGSNAPQTTQPVNTLGSGHSQTLPSTYKPVGDLTKVTKEKPKGSGGSGDNLFMQGVGAVDKAIGQGASYLLGAAGEAFTAPASALIEGFHYLSGKPYNFGNAMPNPGRISAYASGDSDLYKDNRQKTLTELAGVNRDDNPVGAMILDVFTPTLPIASMGKAANASNAIKYAPKANALTNLVTDPYSFIKTMKTPTINPNVGLKFVDETIDSQKALQRVNQNVINPAMQPQLAVNATQAVAKEYTPWTMQEMPGLHIKSTMSGSPFEKQLSKTGELNVSNIQAHINKSDVSAADKFTLQKVLDEKFAGKQKIDYNEFRKAVQEEAVTLERNIIEDDNWANYGVGRLDYPGLKPESYKSSIQNIIDESQYYSTIKNIKKEDLRKIIDNGEEKYLITDRFGRGQYIPADKIDNHLNYEKNIADDFFKNTYPKKAEYEKLLTEIPETKTFTYQNIDKFGKGDARHYNDAALAHTRTMISKEEPDIVHFIEQQSDYWQSGAGKNPVKIDYEKWNPRIEKMEKDLADGYADLEYMKKNNMSLAGDKMEGYQIKQFEDILKAKERDIRLNKGTMANQEQKEFLGKAHQERLLQENVQYAAEQGKQKARYPTRETAAKIQGYSPVKKALSSEEIEKLNGRKRGLEFAISEHYATYGDDPRFNSIIKPFEEELAEINKYKYKPGKDVYADQHETILRKYDDTPKMIQKTLGVKINTVTDAKGNTWYEFDIPDAYKQGKAEIKAFSIGGGAATAAGASQLNKETPQKRFGGDTNPYLKARSGIYVKSSNEKVNCDCGWSWDISDGGSEPYKCHKCGNDNSYAKGQYGLESNLPEAPKNMFSDYNPVSSDYTAAMNGMMKARMATDAEFGNLAAKRMTSLYPKEYTFTGDEMFYDEKVDVPAGATGTHYTTGDGNVMFPIIQEGQDGNLFFNRYANPYNKEAMRFESPQDASYFGENYKNIAPMMYDKGQEGLKAKTKNEYQYQWSNPTPGKPGGASSPNLVISSQFNKSLPYNILETIDPSGITSYPDVYDAWTDGKFTYSDITEPISALPLVGKMFKAGSNAYNIAKGVDIFDTVDDIYNDNVKPNLSSAKGVKKSEFKYNPKMEKGGESDLVPVEVERSERIYDPKGNLLKEIPADAPTHEEGGVKLHLRAGTLVFPKKYYKALDMASTLPEFNKIKEKMLDNAEKAYLRGEPYSSGGKRS
jgi:hypothetical protein